MSVDVGEDGVGLTSLTTREPFAGLMTSGSSRSSGLTASLAFAVFLDTSSPCVNHSSICLISFGGERASFSAAVRNKGTFNPLHVRLPIKDSSPFSFAFVSCR